MYSIPLQHKFTVVCSIFLAVALTVTGSSGADEKIIERQTKIRESVDNALADLYEKQPSAQGAVEKAYGYAVFNNFALKIFLAGSGTGRGIAFNNKTSEETFMRMVEIQAGLGFGAKKFILVWVFESEKAYDQFVNSGWELGGQATAAITTGEKGAEFTGAIAIAPDVWLYQITDKGIAFELTAKGTKYFKDKKLN